LVAFLDAALQITPVSLFFYYNLSIESSEERYFSPHDQLIGNCQLN